MGGQTQNAHSLLNRNRIRRLTRSNNYSWIQMVADAVERYPHTPESIFTTDVMPCNVRGKPSLIVSAALKQQACPIYPYLQQLAYQNNLRLVQNRREASQDVEKDRRQQQTPALALGACLVLNQGREQSHEIVLNDHFTPLQPDMSIHTLIYTAAMVRSQGEHTQYKANRLLIPNHDSHHRISHYGYTIDYHNGQTQFSYLEGKNFHALCYPMGDQLILDIIIGGGPMNAPRLWAAHKRTLRTPIMLHLLGSHATNDNFGIMRASYRLNLVPTEIPLLNC